MLEQRVTMVGLDAAGKTTILYQLHKGERIDTEPTLGFNVEVIEHNGCRLTIWDLGGQEKVRFIHFFFTSIVLHFFLN